MTEELLVQLIAEVEKEDPVDFANLPFDEQMLRDLVCKLVSRQLTQMENAHFSQDEVIRSIEADLRAQGIKVHNSRLWNNCLQTFVTVNGHDVMKFYDPNTRREIPLN